MLASSLAWANKKYTAKELTNGAVTVVLPAVVKVTQVNDAYEKSCPKMSVNTVLFVRGYGKEQRVALKTTDGKHFFSLSLDSPVEFRKVFQHDKGPTILLKNLLVGKVGDELKVELSGNEGNKLSSTPNMSNLVQYGAFQVVGLYTDIVLYTQEVLNEAGELSPKIRTVSVNCPARFDKATGFLRKSPEEFKQFLCKLRMNQSPNADQNESLTELVLMSTPTKTQEMQYLEHISHLYNNVTKESKVTVRDEVKEDQGPTSIKDALEKLKSSSKQDSIPQVQKPVIISQTRRSLILLPNDSSGGNVVYDDAISNVHNKQVNESHGNSSKVDYECVQEEMKLSSKNQSSKDNRPSESSSKIPGVTAYLNNDEIKSATDAYSNTDIEYECLDIHQESSLPQKATASLQNGDYLNNVKLQLGAEEKKLANSPSLTKQSKEDSAIQSVYDDVPYATEINMVNNNERHNSSARNNLPLPAPPPPERRSKTKMQRISIFGRLKPDKIKQKRKATSTADTDYVEPDEPKDPFEPVKKDISGECKWKSASEIPKNIKTFTISDVALCLQLLNMDKYASKFSERNVDGAFLIKMNKKMLVESFQMQEFEAKQLTEFATKKWRPKK